MPNAPSTETLTAQLRACVSSEAAAEFARELGTLRAEPDSTRLLTSFSAAARRLGKASLGADASASVHGPVDAVPLAPFTADVAGRALLLLTLAEAKPDALEDAVWNAYREGDTSEKIAIVRSLSLLPEPERFLDLALDAGRTNETHLFSALACDNPFPARYYPELEFNKLVMKAAFVRVPVERVQGLDRRANAELSRMVLDYVAEQEAAGRGFPAPIWLAVSVSPPPGAVAKMLSYTHHESAEMRLWAVRGLARLGPERVAPSLDERLGVEADERVKAALVEAIELLSPSDDRSRSQ